MTGVRHRAGFSLWVFSLLSLTDEKTEARERRLPALPGRPSAPGPLPAPPPAAEGEEAGRGQGQCTWCPRGEVTGGAPEVGLGDPGSGVLTPASWLGRAGSRGVFPEPPPAAPPRFLPAPRARPAPQLPSLSRRPRGSSFPRGRGPTRPRPTPLRLCPPLLAARLLPSSCPGPSSRFLLVCSPD